MGLQAKHICGYAIKTSNIVFNYNRLLDLDLFDDAEIDELVNNSGDLRDETLENMETQMGLRFHYSEGEPNILELPIDFILKDIRFKHWNMIDIRRAANFYLREKGIDNPEDFEFKSYGYFR